MRPAAENPQHPLAATREMTAALWRHRTQPPPVWLQYTGRGHARSTVEAWFAALVRVAMAPFASWEGTHADAWEDAATRVAALCEAGVFDVHALRELHEFHISDVAGPDVYVEFVKELVHATPGARGP